MHGTSRCPMPTRMRSPSRLPLRASRADPPQRPTVGLPLSRAGDMGHRRCVVRLHPLVRTSDRRERWERPKLIGWTSFRMRSSDAASRRSQPHWPPRRTPAGPPTNDLIARGAYLAAAGDCAACHTEKNGAPLAGGLSMDTPFGPLISPNITPDKATGIGNWSDDEFYRALHEGRSKDGSFLYPAMPFPWYTKVTREDAAGDQGLSVFASGGETSLAPPSHLRFPFNVRPALGAWREALLHAGHVPAGSEGVGGDQPRLVSRHGLAHCGECHNGSCWPVPRSSTSPFAAA